MEPLTIEIQDGRFGKFLLEIRKEYVAKLDARSANTDRQFLDVIVTSAVLMAVSIITSELTPAQRLELKQLYLDKALEVCAQVEKRKKELKARNQQPGK